MTEPANERNEKISMTAVNKTFFFQLYIYIFKQPVFMFEKEV